MIMSNKHPNGSKQRNILQDTQNGIQKKSPDYFSVIEAL